MEHGKVTRRQRKDRPWLRWAVLALAVLALAGSLIATRLLNTRKPVTALPVEVTDTTIARHAPDEVTTIALSMRSGDGWTVTQDADGILWAEGEDRFAVDTTTAAVLLDAACVVKFTDVLSDDPAEYADRMADFGLDQPRAVVTVHYADDASVTMRIGERAGSDETPFYYMTVDGDDRLMTLDVGTKDDLVIERALLHPVAQPVLHKARMDRITITTPEAEYAWALNAAITDGDAADRWMLTSPTTYPADGAAMENLRANLVNLRMGSYVAAASPETLADFGFDAPRMVLTVHQAAGSLGMTGITGAYNVVDWPEDEVTLTVGAAASDVLDYVLFDGSIYTTSHFLLDVFMKLQPAVTLTRYPVLTSLGNLASLTVTKDGAAVTYAVTRAERVAPNNELVYDEDGQPEVDVTVTCDGEPMAWSAFEAAYNDLLLVTVSGTLPSGWTPSEPVHTAYRFETVTGVTHTLELARFDALHDAVLVDGCAMFYLVKGGIGIVPGL